MFIDFLVEDFPICTFKSALLVPGLHSVYG